MPNIQVQVPAVSLVYDKRALRAVLRAAGAEVAAVARALIRRAHGTGRRYGRHRASAPGEPPASFSGALAGAIRVRAARNGESVRVIDTEYYSRFLETGAHGGGGASRIKANILPAGGFRGQNRMRASAVNRTRVLEPRPFLTRAVEERGPSIAERVRQAVTEGVKFQRRNP